MCSLFPVADLGDYQQTQVGQNVHLIQGPVEPANKILSGGAAGDIAGQGTFSIGRGLSFVGGFEGVIIGGRTTIANGDHDFHHIVQGGVSVRSYVGRPDTWLAGFDAWSLARSIDEVLRDEALRVELGRNAAAAARPYEYSAAIGRYANGLRVLAGEEELERPA